MTALVSVTFNTEHKIMAGVVLNDLSWRLMTLFTVTTAFVTVVPVTLTAVLCGICYLWHGGQCLCFFTLEPYHTE